MFSGVCTPLFECGIHLGLNQDAYRQRVHAADERFSRRAVKTGFQILRSGPGRIDQTRPIQTYNPRELTLLV